MQAPESPPHRPPHNYQQARQHSSVAPQAGNRESPQPSSPVHPTRSPLADRHYSSAQNPSAARSPQSAPAKRTQARPTLPAPRKIPPPPPSSIHASKN